MSHTWLPSQTGPTVLMTMRRSASVRATNGSSDADAEVEAVHDGKADQQDAEEQPPDQAQGFVVEHDAGSFGAASFRRSASRRPARAARISAIR